MNTMPYMGFHVCMHVRWTQGDFILTLVKRHCWLARREDSRLLVMVVAVSCGILWRERE